MSAELIPLHFCCNCAHFNDTKPATCTERAVLTQDPVYGTPVWQGLLQCSARRVGGRKHECPHYKEK